MLDDSVFVDHDICSQRPLIGLALHVVAFEDAIGREHLFVHVAEQRKFNIDLLRESGVGRWRIHADAKNFRIRRIDFPCVDSRLDRLELFRSTTGKGKNVHRQKHVLLAFEVAELHGFPLVA